LLILVEFFNTKKHTIMAFEIQVLVWNRHKNVAGLNWLMGSKPSTLIIESQKDNTDINKQKQTNKSCADLLSHKKTTRHLVSLFLFFFFFFL
jgi:hypothetical protein